MLKRQKQQLRVPVKPNPMEALNKNPGDPRGKKVFPPPSLIEEEGPRFAFMDFFIIIFCVVIGAAISLGYLMYSDGMKDQIIAVVQKEIQTAPVNIDNKTVESALAEALSEEQIEKLRGLPGADGKDGKPGSVGLRGKPGSQGIPGPQGPQGLTGLPGAQGLQGLTGSAGLQGPPGPPGPSGSTGEPVAGSKPLAINGVAGWEMLESRSFKVLPGQRKTVMMSCSSGKILLGGGYNASGCGGCTAETNYPSSTNSWETTLTNPENSKAIDLKVYVTCAEPTFLR